MALPQARGIQLEVIDLPPKGHTVVLGTAGSGKTTLAIYRAKYLSSITDDGKVLLLTFNKTLVKYLEAIAGEELSNVDVRNYHFFARGYLSARGKMGNNKIVSGMEDGDNKKLILVKKAQENVIRNVGINSTLKRDGEVFLEEISWIQKMGIESLEEYQSVERVGRVGTRIIRENRKFFYMVFEEYKNVRASEGYLYDWDDMASAVLDEFTKDNKPRMYKHIVIDEGQDLSPIMLKSLIKAIPADGSLTFFGDVGQQIYGNRVSWHSAGLKVSNKEIWRFDRNYRNSKQIAKLALAIAKSKYFTGESDLVEPVMPKASSPLPALVKFDDEVREINWIKDTISKLPRNGSIAILVRSRKKVEQIDNIVREIGIRPQVLKRKMQRLNNNALLSIGTYHSAKGLEFDTVILPFCSTSELPSQDRIIALESREEALKEEVKLLYVAVTRAKKGLIITCSGEKTELLPENKEMLYDERENL